MPSSETPLPQQPTGDVRRLECVVAPEFEGMSVERVLRNQLNLTHRTVARAKFVPMGILLDGQRVRVSTRVRAGQVVSAAIGDSEVLASHSNVDPEPGPLDIVFEDDDLVILNKPANLAVHPAPGHQHGTLGNFLLWHLQQQGLASELHMVNRLDKGTSGLMVCAKNATSQHRLQQCMHTQRFSRTYLAVCEGVPDPLCGTIDAPIAKLQDDAALRGVRDWGKPAVTHYKVEQSPDPRSSLVRVVLETGRTHQIRVHFSHIGHPLVGDEMYGRPSDLIDRPALHSWRLAIDHPITGERLSFEAPLPQDIQQLLV